MILEVPKEGYFIITEREDICAALKTHGLKNVLLESEINDKAYRKILKIGYGIIFIKYIKDENDDRTMKIFDKFKQDLYFCRILTNEYFCEEEIDDDYVIDYSIESFIEKLKDRTTLETIESVAYESGIKFSTDFKNNCGNCGSELEENDKYCKVCGTRRGEGKFKPHNNIVECLYGPKVTVKFVCKKCNHSWSETRLGYSDAKYCPSCGGEAQNVETLYDPLIVDDKDIDLFEELDKYIGK